MKTFFHVLLRDTLFVPQVCLSQNILSFKVRPCATRGLNCAIGMIQEINGQILWFGKFLRDFLKITNYRGLFFNKNALFLKMGSTSKEETSSGMREDAWYYICNGFLWKYNKCWLVVKQGKYQSTKKEREF